MRLYSKPLTIIFKLYRHYEKEEERETASERNWKRKRGVLDFTGEGQALRRCIISVCSVWYFVELLSGCHSESVSEKYIQDFKA